MLAEYFIMPETIFTLGIAFIAILSVKKSALEKSHGSIDIGSLKKEDILKLSKEELSSLRKIIIYATITLFLTTAVISLPFCFLLDRTLPNLIICILVQLALMLICGKPFMKKIKAFKR